MLQDVRDIKRFEDTAALTEERIKAPLIKNQDGGLELSEKGFTLIEVMIGILLLAIGLLSIGGMQMTAVKGNFFSHYLTQATYVGQDRLETLNNLPVDSAELQEGQHNDGTVEIAGIAFNRSYTVTVDGDTRTIVYTISWNDGVNRTISFSTIRSI